MSDREETIRKRAYAIWEREDRPEGRHADHWEMADREFGDGHSADADTSKDSHTAAADADVTARRLQDSGQETIKVTKTRVETTEDRTESTPV